MLCPEVCNFEAPKSTFKFEKINNEKNLTETNINKFYFNHLVSVTLPDSLKFPENLTDKLINDCEYYKICDLNPSDLLNINFLKFFVRSGKLSLLTINTRIDCDNCICITPNGELILSVDKETFQSLGIDGKISHFTKQNKDRYIININLKEDYLEPGKSNYEKIKSRLETLGKFTIIVLWEPAEEDICPSSVAKYFSDIGYRVDVSFPSLISNTIYSVNVPEVPFASNDEEDVADFAEWLGMISLDGTLERQDSDGYLTSYVTPEPCEKLGQVKYLQWRGFFAFSKIKDLLLELMQYASSANKPWISVYVQGFSDSPVAWGSEEHHYYTNGDNAYLTIFNETNCLLCTQKCSKKRYK